MPAYLLWLGFAAAALAWVHHAYVDKPWRKPEAAALVAAWEEWSKGKLTTLQLDTLARKATVIRHEVRGRVGEEDPLCVEAIFTTGHYPGDKDDVASETLLYVDGEAWHEQPKGRLASYGYGGPSRYTRLALRGLGAGRHEVALVSSLSLLSSGAAIWSRTHYTRHAVEVVPGSTRGEIALVTPARFDPEFFFYPSERRNDNEKDGRVIWFHTEPSAVAVCSRVELLDASGRCVSSGILRCRPGEANSTAFWLDKLPTGTHTLSVVVCPLPEKVLEESATITEILGVRWRSSLKVEKR